MTSREELKDYVKLLVGTHGLSNAEAAHVANEERGLRGDDILTRNAVIGICYRAGIKKASDLSTEGRLLLRKYGVSIIDFFAATKSKPTTDASVFIATARNRSGPSPSMPLGTAGNHDMLPERHSPRARSSTLEEDIPPDVLAPHLFRAAPYKPGDENI